MLVSTSNEFDKLARYMHHIELNQQLQLQQPTFNVIEVQYSPDDDANECAAQPEPDDALL